MNPPPRKTSQPARELSLLVILVTGVCLLTAPGIAAGPAPPELSRQEAQKAAEKLREEIRYHDHRYYVLNDPVISDAEYDALKRKLLAIERAFPELRTPDSPTQRVGAAPQPALREVTHPTPMLSLDSTVNPTEVRAFDAQCREKLGIQTNLEYVAELKYDGLAIEIVYRNGTLVSASTRGDGHRGQNVTRNVKTIPSIPQQLDNLPGQPLPTVLRLRGEVYMPRTQFHRLNRERRASGKQAFATPRNAAAGSLLQNNPDVTAQRGLGAYFFGIGGQDLPGCSTQWQVLTWLADRALPVHPLRRQCENIRQASDFRETVVDRRANLDLDVDGIVIKINRLDYQRRLGNGRTSPHWALAYKFPPQTVTTRLNKVILGVGRTGLLTPVAVLAPVNIAGVQVRRASLHSIEEIRKRDLRIGDTVYLRRSGGVIPHVVRPVKSLRTGSETPVQVPTQCPACGVSLLVGAEGRLRCPSFYCPARLAGRVAHFASSNGMDIEGFGKRTAELLVDKGLVKSVADVYDLNRKGLLGIDGFGTRSANKLIRAIDASRDAPLRDVICGLGLPSVGPARAGTISRHLGCLEALLGATEEDLEGLPNIGPRIANELVDYLSRPHTRATIRQLHDAGVGR